MASMVKGVQQFGLIYGQYVKRAVKKLPDNTTENLFTVTGGPVLVTLLVGRYITASDGTVTTLQLTTLATGGTGANLSTAVSVASKEIGTTVSLTDAAGGALVVNTAGAPATPIRPFTLNTGSLVAKTVGTVSTGTMVWYLAYLPLEPGGVVAAA